MSNEKNDNYFTDENGVSWVKEEHALAMIREVKALVKELRGEVQEANNAFNKLYAEHNW